jgi:hypothetical protein
MESEEIILATWGVSAPFGASPSGTPIVGIWEGVLIACLQDLQNLLSDGISAEHFGH